MVVTLLLLACRRDRDIGARQRGRKKKILFSIIRRKLCGVGQKSLSPSRDSQNGKKLRVTDHTVMGMGDVPKCVGSGRSPAS